MSYKQLFIFVEGPDDERYIDTIVRPQLEERYSFIKIIKYASLTKIVIESFIKTYKKQIHTDYLFICDMDAKGDNSLCITKRKEKEQNKYGSYLEIDKIIVVKEEIESWYLAGITPTNLVKFKIKSFSDTQLVTKEAFEKMIPKNFISPNDFMVEVLKEYSLTQAKNINNSLKYFVNKYL
jgi:hypothetical protein